MTIDMHKAEGQIDALIERRALEAEAANREARAWAESARRYALRRAAENRREWAAARGSEARRPPLDTAAGARCLLARPLPCSGVRGGR